MSHTGTFMVSPEDADYADARRMTGLYRESPANTGFERSGPFLDPENR